MFDHTKIIVTIKIDGMSLQERKPEILRALNKVLYEYFNATIYPTDAGIIATINADPTTGFSSNANS